MLRPSLNSTAILFKNLFRKEGRDNTGMKQELRKIFFAVVGTEERFEKVQLRLGLRTFFKYYF